MPLWLSAIPLPFESHPSRTGLCIDATLPDFRYVMDEGWHLTRFENILPRRRLAAHVCRASGFSLFPCVNVAPVTNRYYEYNLPSFINIQYRPVIPNMQFEFRSTRESPNVARRIVNYAVDFSYNPGC